MKRNQLLLWKKFYFLSFFLVLNKNSNVSYYIWLLKHMQKLLLLEVYFSRSFVETWKLCLYSIYLSSFLCYDYISSIYYRFSSIRLNMLLLLSPTARFKRIIAYSSINHMNLVTIGCLLVTKKLFRCYFINRWPWMASAGYLLARYHL